MLISPKSPTEISLSLSRVRRYMSNMALVSKKRAIQRALQWNLHEDTAISKFFSRVSSLATVYTSSFSAVFENLKLRQTTVFRHLLSRGSNWYGKLYALFPQRLSCWHFSGLEENKFYVCDVETGMRWLVWFNMDFFPSNVLKMSW